MTPRKRTPPKPPPAVELQSALGWLKSHATRTTLEGMARYAIPSDKAIGVAMRDIKALGKTLGRNHNLAAALWNTGLKPISPLRHDPARSAANGPW